jgi:hypothetical protein
MIFHSQQADAPNPSMTLQLTFKHRWLGVGDPLRWATRMRMRALPVLAAASLLGFTCGCGGPRSVPPVIDSTAYAQRSSDGTYEIQLRYSITSSGGPCFSKDWFKTWTSHTTNWLYVKEPVGTVTADRLILTTDAGKRDWPYAMTNLHGTVSFTNETMIVRLEQPDVDSKGNETSRYVPYYLNGIYHISEGTH